METHTVITSRPRTRRTPLGDVVTVCKSVYDNGLIEEHITVECAPEVVEPGREWPAASTRDVWAGRT